MKRIFNQIVGYIKWRREPKYRREDIINISIEAYRLSKHHNQRWIETEKFIKWVDEQIIKLHKS